MAISRALSWVVVHAAYPAIIVTTICAADLALTRGVSAAWVVTGAFLAVLALVAALERIWPFDPRTNPRFEEARQDLSYLGLAALLQPMGKLGGTWLAAIVTLAISAGIDASRWPLSWPSWVRIGLALALADAAKYWVHRLAHERPWLWRFHAEHHAPERLYSLNGIRLHPVNLLWNLVLDGAPPLVLGLDARSIVLVAVFRGTVAVLQHANVGFRLGPLNWIFSTPELHRWHHSTALREGNSNYGSSFILWDVLFGTRRLPRDRTAPVALGLADAAPHPRGLWHELVWPWCSAKADRCRLVRGWERRGVDNLLRKY